MAKPDVRYRQPLFAGNGDMAKLFAQTQAKGIPLPEDYGSSGDAMYPGNGMIISCNASQGAQSFSASDLMAENISDFGEGSDQ